MKAMYLLCCCAILAIGCSSVDVTTDYDREANFAAFKTFDWMERHNPRDGGPGGNVGLNDPLAQKHIKNAVVRELLTKGIKQTESSPDLLVMVHAATQNKVDIDRYGYRYGRYGRRVGVVTTVDRYKEGTILIDLVDAKSKDLVWRGTAQDALRSGDSRADYIDECMKQLFKEYPPTK
jgi:hypothetical protein